MSSSYNCRIQVMHPQDLSIRYECNKHFNSEKDIEAFARDSYRSFPTPFCWFAPIRTNSFINFTKDLLAPAYFEKSESEAENVVLKKMLRSAYSEIVKKTITKKEEGYLRSQVQEMQDSEIEEIMMHMAGSKTPKEKIKTTALKVMRFVSLLAALVIDLCTVPVRLITALPIAIYQKLTHHKVALNVFLKAKKNVDSRLLSADRVYLIIQNKKEKPKKHSMRGFISHVHFIPTHDRVRFVDALIKNEK